MSRHSRRFRSVVLLALFTGGSAALAGAEVTAAADPAVVAALSRQADQWDQDIVHKNAGAIAANMAEEFRQIGSDGAVADKASFVRALTSPELTIDPYGVEEFEVRILGAAGDVAQLSGRTRMTGRYRGEPFTTHYRYIDTYVRRDGRWQVVSVQTSEIREAAPN